MEPNPSNFLDVAQSHFHYRKNGTWTPPIFVFVCIVSIIRFSHAVAGVGVGVGAGAGAGAGAMLSFWCGVSLCQEGSRPLFITATFYTEDYTGKWELIEVMNCLTAPLQLLQSMDCGYASHASFQNSISADDGWMRRGSWGVHRMTILWGNKNRGKRRREALYFEYFSSKVPKKGCSVLISVTKMRHQHLTGLQVTLQAISKNCKRTRKVSVLADRQIEHSHWHIGTFITKPWQILPSQH